MEDAVASLAEHFLASDALADSIQRKSMLGQCCR